MDGASALAALASAASIAQNNSSPSSVASNLKQETTNGIKKQIEEVVSNNFITHDILNYYPYVPNVLGMGLISGSGSTGYCYVVDDCRYSAVSGFVE